MTPEEIFILAFVFLFGVGVGAGRGAIRMRQTRRAFFTANEQLGITTERLSEANITIARQDEVIGRMKVDEQRHLKTIEALHLRERSHKAKLATGLSKVREIGSGLSQKLLPAVVEQPRQLAVRATRNLRG
jgi:hypothetical protein